MPSEPGRIRPLLIVLTLLSISVLLDRYLVSVLCPWMPSLGGTSLMIVFLDIPVALPLIDPLPVAVLFSLFYTMIPTRQTDGGGGGLSSIWGGVFILACWMTAGALLYASVQGFLPRQVRNDIDSFGVIADINTPFSAEFSILHLRGGFILLVCFFFGGRTLLKRIHRAAVGRPVAHPPQPAPERVKEDIPVCTTIAVQPPTPARPRATVKSVSVVAPQRVHIYANTEEASPLR